MNANSSSGLPHTQHINSDRSAFFAAVGDVLTRYDVELGSASFIPRESVRLPGFITEACVHPSGKYLYVAWCDRFLRPLGPDGGARGLSAFVIDPEAGVLQPHGHPAALTRTPGYLSAVTTDITGQFLIVSDSTPSRLAVFPINQDGTIGDELTQSPLLDFGIHAHQVRMDPSNKTVTLVGRGQHPLPDRPEEPGGLKIFSFKDGILSNAQTVAEKDGWDYQPRHMDFHPSGKWVFVTLERQNQLLVYERNEDGLLGAHPIFVRDTLIDPSIKRPGVLGQILGTVHVHPNGAFVYVANRASSVVEPGDKKIFAGGENNIVVFSIDQSTGEPTLIQHIDTQGLHARTFSFDPTCNLLVAGNVTPMIVRQGGDEATVPASLAVFRMANDGKLSFLRKYDIDVGGSEMWWVSFVLLP